jgi:hypothetical protein
MEPRRKTRQVNVGGVKIGGAGAVTLFRTFACGCLCCRWHVVVLAMLLLPTILSGCGTPPKTGARGRDVSVRAPLNAPHPADGAGEATAERTESPFEMWQRWQSVVPLIVSQVLEREDGSVTLSFRLENRGQSPVFLASFEPCFVSGTYYTHPGGDPYEVTGDDRHIAIWLSPSYYWNRAPSTNKIGPGENRLFTVSVEVPADMPNPVTTGVALDGPIIEMDGWLGQTCELRWVAKDGDVHP